MSSRMELTDDEARQILSRFIASHFREKEHARFSIPANEDRDDDIRMSRYIASVAALRAENAALRAGLTPFALLSQLRSDGWSVAIHNDYWQAGERMTFWLLTRADGVWTKGEGRTDEEALKRAVEGARSYAEPALRLPSQDIAVGTGEKT